MPRPWATCRAVLPSLSWALILQPKINCNNKYSKLHNKIKSITSIITSFVSFLSLCILEKINTDMLEHTNSNEKIHHPLVSLWNTYDQRSSSVLIPCIYITRALQKTLKYLLVFDFAPNLVKTIWKIALVVFLNLINMLLTFLMRTFATSTKSLLAAIWRAVNPNLSAISSFAILGFLFRMISTALCKKDLNW